MPAEIVRSIDLAIFFFIGNCLKSVDLGCFLDSRRNTIVERWKESKVKMKQGSIISLIFLYCR